MTRVLAPEDTKADIWQAVQQAAAVRDQRDEQGQAHIKTPADPPAGTEGNTGPRQPPGGGSPRGRAKNPSG